MSIQPIALALIAALAFIALIAKVIKQSHRIRVLIRARSEMHELCNRMKEDTVNASNNYEGMRRKLAEIDKGRGILAKAFEGASVQMRDMELKIVNADTKLIEAETDRLKLMDQLAKKEARIQQLEAKLASKIEDYNLLISGLRDLQADYLSLQRNAKECAEIEAARQQNGLA